MSRKKRRKHRAEDPTRCPGCGRGFLHRIYMLNHALNQCDCRRAIGPLRVAELRTELNRELLSSRDAAMYF